MGWFCLYLLTCVVNTVLILVFTDLNIGDAAMWLWITIPGIAFGCGEAKLIEEALKEVDI